MSWYRLVFLMKSKYGWGVSEIEDMYPFEFDVYLLLTMEQVEKERARQEGAQSL